MESHIKKIIVDDIDSLSVALLIRFLEENSNPETSPKECFDLKGIELRGPLGSSWQSLNPNLSLKEISFMSISAFDLSGDVILIKGNSGG
tara:strand:+ start:1664 stop:1933 length:270 start_codon:yes stop_codon:yes gene_type:complete